VLSSKPSGYSVTSARPRSVMRRKRCRLWPAGAAPAEERSSRNAFCLYVSSAKTDLPPVRHDSTRSTNLPMGHPVSSTLGRLCRLQ
jgi:hypothetical protein